MSQLNQGPPSVDVSFFIFMLKKSSKVVGIIENGSSTAYIVRGAKQFVAGRIIPIRNTAGQVDYEFATGTAIKLKCTDELLEWFRVNRNWKDGGYFTP